MALTFPFRGPIPNWLNPNTDGHLYLEPPEVPVKYAGRALLDGASAVYAFAPEHLRRDLNAANEALRLLDVPTDPDRRQTLQWIDHLHRENQEVIPEQTTEFQAWMEWHKTLNAIRQDFFCRLHNGQFTAFGDPNGPGSPSHWIHPLAWMALEPDPRIPAKFSGDDLVFWNVRMVSTLTVIAMDEAREVQVLPQAEEMLEKTAKPKRHTLSDEVTRWFREYKDRFIKDPFHPSLDRDVKAARRELQDKTITRLEIDLLRKEFVEAKRRPIGRRPKSPK